MSKVIFEEADRVETIAHLERMERSLSEADLTGLAEYALWVRTHDKLFKVAEAEERGEQYKALLRKVIRESLKGLDMKQVTAIWECAANHLTRADKRKGA